MDLIGNEKVGTIDGNDADSMKAASSYLTEVTAAWGLALAMVKNDKLPAILKAWKRPDKVSICNVEFDELVAKDEELAARNRDEAQTKLKMFLQKAIDLSKDKKHPVLVMAPQNRMGVDFLVLQDKGLAAVEMKSKHRRRARKTRRAKRAAAQSNKDHL